MTTSGRRGAGPEATGLAAGAAVQNARLERLDPRSSPFLMASDSGVRLDRSLAR